VDGDARARLDADGRSRLGTDGRTRLDADGRARLDADGQARLDADGRADVDADGRLSTDARIRDRDRDGFRDRDRNWDRDRYWDRYGRWDRTGRRIARFFLPGTGWTWGYGPRYGYWDGLGWGYGPWGYGGGYYDGYYGGQYAYGQSYYSEPGYAAAPSPRTGLGVYMDERDNAVFVQSVVPGSPAEQAGLEPGDVIIAISGNLITSADQVRQIVAEHEPGDELEIETDRDGREVRTAAVLEEHRQVF
jgi:hypothetical protein